MKDIPRSQLMFEIDGHYTENSIAMDKIKCVKKMPDLQYNLKCKCGNILAASHTPLPKWLIEKCKDTPCSVCVRPEDFIKKYET